MPCIAGFNFKPAHIFRTGPFYSSLNFLNWRLYSQKRSGDAAEEVMEDATQRVKRHPVGALSATFALGVLVGGIIGWMVSRR